MIQDSSTVTRGSRIDTGICIIGGGTNGIGMALRLQGRGHDVVVLESGAETPDDAINDLSKGDIGGLPYFPLRNARPRLLGGASNYWAGWSRPIDPFDVEARAWIPYSGWPIDWSQLSPYLAPALELCEIPDAEFDASAWSHVAPDLYRPPYAAGEVKPTVWVGSPPTKFGKVYRDRLAAADDVRVLLRATVTELVTDEAGSSVDEVRVGTLDGHAFTVRARAVVLAVGALETPKLLLHSKQGAKRGLGNEHDVVGRYFMEHPHVVTGRVKVAPRRASSRAEIPALDARLLKGSKARLAMERPQKGLKFAYTLTEEALREHELSNWSAHLRTTSHARGGPEVYHAMKLMVGNLRSTRTLLRQIRKGALPRGVRKQLGTLARHPDDVLRILYQQLIQKPRTLELYAQSEQVPNPSSRVRLSDDVDAMGVPRIVLEWRLDDQDKRSTLEAQRLLGRQLEATGVGTIEHEPWLEDPDAGWGDALSGGYHHLGTARMGTDRATSVVDADCRVHSVRNLYVGDASVMPTGGYANPLVTGLALALRTADIVADHVAKEAHAAA